MNNAPVIVWFRQDLRLQDNPALFYGALKGPVLALYILDDVNAASWSMGAASRWWLHHSLERLNHSLEQRLVCIAGDAARLIPELVKTFGAQAVYWNRCYEPWRRKRDQAIKQQLQQGGIACESFNGSLLWEPWQIAKPDGLPYKVFTPFLRNACSAAPPPQTPLPAPAMLTLVDPDGYRGTVAALNLLPKIPWHEKLAKHWQPGESAARTRLDSFLDQGLADYRLGRDFPDRKSVSRLSPHLHHGEISPRQVWHTAAQAAGGTQLESQLEHFQRELAWREFSYYLLYHAPVITDQNLQGKFDGFPWRQDQKDFDLWCRGLTGYPIVDAGMRELWQTGYMHNRVRMIVASFLVKNLMIHWRKGQRWFWDCLVDADLASNSASWQWVAGSGADAAPYFRIFNPVTQGCKFDPAGNYVRRFVPELAALPDRYLHDPSSAPENVLKAAGVVLGQTYPAAMIDLGLSRNQALTAYRSLS